MKSKSNISIQDLSAPFLQYFYLYTFLTYFDGTLPQEKVIS